MKKCLFGICDGNGLIVNEEKTEFCQCVRYVNALAEYKKTGASDEHKKFVQQLNDGVFVKSHQSGQFVDMKKTISQFSKADVLIPAIEKGTRILIDGVFQVGKTQMACSIILQALKRNLKCVFIDSRSFGDLAYDQKSKTDLMERIKGCDVLVVDDLGAEMSIQDKREGYIQKTMDQVLRSHTGLLIVTSNGNVENLKSLYTEERLMAYLFKNKNWVQYTVMDSPKKEENKNTIDFL